MKTQTQTQITQLIPALGWKAVGCGIDDEVFFFDVPVVGWGIVRTREENETDDAIQLFVFHDYVQTVSECECSNTLVVEVPPGVDFDDEDKARLERRVRDKMAAAKRREVEAK